MPEIRAMLQTNPLSTYAAWQPRQIAGSNPAYDMLFNQVPQMQSALGGLNLVFGGPQAFPQSGDAGLSQPNFAMSGGTGGTMGGQGSNMPAPPPQFQPASIEDIVNQQVAAQVQPAVKRVADQYAALEGPVGGQFWSGGAPLGNIVQTTYEGSGFPRVILDNGQMYTNYYGQGWVNG